MKRTPLKRKTPLKSKPTRLRRVSRKPTSISTDKADKLFSIYVRTRDPICIFRLSTKVRPKAKDCTNPSTQNSHFWGRANSATRYDPDNCDGICGGCHMRHEGNKQGLYSEIKRWQLGNHRYVLLSLRAQEIKKRSEAIAECLEFLKKHG